MSQGYELEQPTADDLVSSLHGVLDPADVKAALGLALRDADSARLELAEHSPAQLLAVAQALTRQRGLVAVIGRSFEIRLLSWLELSGASEVEP